MKNNIIIAGVPRAGKSTLSHLLSQTFGYQHVSMDAIIAGFERIFPESGIVWWPSKAADAPPLNVLRGASEKIAQLIAAMLDSGEYDEFEPGMVVDVYQLFPEHYEKYLSGHHCEIMYLVTSDVTPEERFSILKAHDTKSDYTFHTPDDELREGCKQLVEHSQFIKKQCIAWDLPYYETAKSREDVFRRIVNSLCNAPIDGYKMGP